MQFATRLRFDDKLVVHCSHIKVLEESVTECVVDLEERTDHGVRESLFDQLDMRHPEESSGEGNTKLPNSRHRDPSQSKDESEASAPIRSIRVKVVSFRGGVR